MALISKDVLSSHVASVGYDDDADTLHVVYKNGQTVVYRDVDHKDASSVMNAPSIGQALHADIRGKYEFRYLSEDEE